MFRIKPNQFFILYCCNIIKYMSCAGKGYGASVIRPRKPLCRRYRHGFLPSFVPVIVQLSVTTSKSGAYALVYIKGSNFLPNGTTLVKFGTMGLVPNVYYTASLLGFTVPLNAESGSYQVQVVNVYNGNFSPQVSQSYPGIPNYSNAVTFTVT